MPASSAVCLQDQRLCIEIDRTHAQIACQVFVEVVVGQIGDMRAVVINLGVICVAVAMSSAILVSTEARKHVHRTNSRSNNLLHHQAHRLLIRTE